MAKKKAAAKKRAATNNKEAAPIVEKVAPLKLTPLCLTISTLLENNWSMTQLVRAIDKITGVSDSEFVQALIDHFGSIDDFMPLLKKAGWSADNIFGALNDLGWSIREIYRALKIIYKTDEIISVFTEVGLDDSEILEILVDPQNELEVIAAFSNAGRSQSEIAQAYVGFIDGDLAEVIKILGVGRAGWSAKDIILALSVGQSKSEIIASMKDTGNFSEKDIAQALVLVSDLSQAVYDLWQADWAIVQIFKALMSAQYSLTDIVASCCSDFGSEEVFKTMKNLIDDDLVSIEEVAKVIFNNCWNSDDIIAVGVEAGWPDDLVFEVLLAYFKQEK